ncbi:endonuclease/exonuclease/phosphatase family protein [uncultured Mesonia sp.]|uniref:endonuclease/exonuclease/phosphatase family protein n=1 Tax=uncultured Mesonia sp. TaxID=399731 RepID=UPI00374E5C8C
MKGLSVFNKLVFFINTLVALALLLAYLLPYIPPVTFPFLSVLSLGLPIFFLLNFIFVIYWLLGLKRQVFLSLLIILIGFNHLLSLYKIRSLEAEVDPQKAISLMTFNVRQFNVYDWLPQPNLKARIGEFIAQEDPDILLFQEYNHQQAPDLSQYAYSYLPVLKGKASQAIYSKYPIINRASADFKNTGNNALYADLVIKEDTIRVFNIHLESLKINPSVKELQKENREQLITRVGRSFRKQQQQTEQILALVNQSHYPSIVAGDLNNSAFSYVYRRLSENFNDAFKMAGEGFGKTFVFDFIPLRIDVILTSPAFKIIDFKNYSEQLSDHYPIKSTFYLDKSVANK